MILENVHPTSDAHFIPKDGIDFADFLGLAREHLDLAELVKYLETPPQPPSDTRRTPAQPMVIARVVGWWCHGLEKSCDVLT